MMRQHKSPNRGEDGDTRLLLASLDSDEGELLHSLGRCVHYFAVASVCHYCVSMCHAD